MMGPKAGLKALQKGEISNAMDDDQVRQEADLPSGIGLYQNASDFNTNSAESYDSWGWTLADNQQYEAAIEQFQKAIATGPDRVERFYHSWGLVLAAQGHYEAAIEKYQEVSNINQAYVDVYESWGWALAKQEKYSQAIELFQNVIAANPKNVERYYHCWGLILATQGHHEAAIVQYQKACDCNPKYTETYRSWGLALADLNQFDEAITKNPEHAADYYYRWGWVLTTQKRYQEAINLFEKAIHLSSSHETNDCLGVALDQQKRAVKAISTFKQAIIELNQDDFPTSHTVTAALWYRQCYEKWQKNRFVYEQMH
jgi:tetratricopeptide (TPR) repeat protein